jgi:hypothetical protein
MWEWLLAHLPFALGLRPKSDQNQHESPASAKGGIQCPPPTSEAPASATEVHREETGFWLLPEIRQNWCSDGPRLAPTLGTKKLGARSGTGPKDYIGLSPIRPPRFSEGVGRRSGTDS